jgi:hypothetical protein
MYVCVVNRQGDILLHQDIKNNDFAFFLKKIQPFRHDLTVTAECMFAWYWLADACVRENLPFVLAHALYLRAIHGGKTKMTASIPRSWPGCWPLTRSPSPTFKANAIVANQLGRAIYFMMKNRTVFDLDEFLRAA